MMIISPGRGLYSFRLGGGKRTSNNRKVLKRKDDISRIEKKSDKSKSYLPTIELCRLNKKFRSTFPEGISDQQIPEEVQKHNGQSL